MGSKGKLKRAVCRFQQRFALLLLRPLDWLLGISIQKTASFKGASVLQILQNMQSDVRSSQYSDKRQIKKFSLKTHQYFAHQIFLSPHFLFLMRRYPIGVKLCHSTPFTYLLCSLALLAFLVPSAAKGKPTFNNPYTDLSLEEVPPDR